MKSDDELRIRILTTAYLRGQGRPQDEIAELLKISQGQVSKLGTAAKKQGLLEHRFQFVGKGVSEAEMDRIRHLVAGSTTQKSIAAYVRHLGDGIAPTIRVFSSGDKSASDGGWQRKLHAFSRRAAPYLRELLARTNACATTWGGTIATMVTALSDMHESPPRKGHPATVIPLCGEPLGERPTSFSSSSLADRLAVFLNGNARLAYSIGMIPAFLPEEFTDRELAVIWKLIGYAGAYAAIFGQRGAFRKRPPAKLPRAPLAEQMDTVLTSVSPPERPLGFGMGRLFLAGRLTEDDLRQMVIGDIGGICLPRPDVSEERKLQLAGLEKRWTGVTRHQLEQCARRSAGFKGRRSAAPPGVIVIAIGSNKARCVLEAIKGGLINHLIVDSDLDQELGRLCLAP